jgi:hypothetical protein
VVVLIFVVGGMSLYKGYQYLQTPTPLTDPTWNYWVLAYHEFRKTQGEQSFWQTLRSSRDPAVFAILLEDLAALVGLLIALAGIFFGRLFHNLYFDGAASMVIGLLLVGEDASPEVPRQLETPDPAGCCRGRVARPAHDVPGPDRRHPSLRRGLSRLPHLMAVGVKHAVEHLQAVIKAQHPEFRRIFIEASSLTDSTGAARP